MTALIIDDEEQGREMLGYYLKEFFPDLIIVGKTANIIDGARVFYAEQPDIVFLDITMPGGSGFDLTRQVDFSSTLVIFVTAHSEYAIDAIRINAFDYLLKPVHITELTRVINKCRQVLKGKSSPVRTEHKIKLKYDGKTLVLEPDEIFYARSAGNYTDIYLTGDRKVMLTKNIKKIEEEFLTGFPFFRPHQSYIVNLRKVVQFDASEIRLENGVEVPVSKNRYDEFRDLIDRI